MKLLPLAAILAALLSGGCACNDWHGRPPHRPHRPTQLPATPPPAVVPPQAQVTPPADGQGADPGHAHGNWGGNEDRIELKTEDFFVGKRTEDAGSARIRRYVVRQNVSVPINLCHDTIDVIREPASGPANGPWWDQESYIEVPLSREVATPRTTQRLYEVVKIRKVTVCETNNIGGVTRTERVEVIR